MNSLRAELPFRPLASCRSEKLARGLAIMNSPIDELGCFATKRFAKDEFIAEYTGERINQREAMRRMRGQGRTCVTELEADCYIDGSVGGNGTQYINHSCEPNADALIVDGYMIIIPLQDIAPGEEITIDYLNSFDEDRTVCQCRSTSCKERIS
ncbi:MAG TPA: SET domain-containing protein-lysine N-methyltransferase [Pyrinomonadaceae bacterium]|jgi:SET domain-containing protein|nr:SET domain-containing protein-lysine N-methyltransferase [Pyrinomonadaceae bacterium]